MQITDRGRHLRLLLADDHALFSAGLAMILETVIFPSCEVIQVKSWTEVLSHVGDDSFDMVLVDLFMPGKNGWKEELAELLLVTKETPVCVISSSSSKDNIHTVFELGAHGFVHKSINPEKMKQALTKVAAGKVYFPKRLDMPSSAEKATPKYSLVTARQQEILFLLAEGKGNQQIATTLNLRESTVKRHVYNICKALKVRNRGEAVHVARQTGLLVD